MHPISRSTLTLALVVALALTAFSIPLVSASKAGLPGAPLAQTVVTFGANADTFVRSTSTQNFGSRVYLGVDGAGMIEHTFIRFTVSGIPAGATIDSAILRIQVRGLTETEADSTSDGTAIPVQVTTTSTTWDELVMTYATQPACGGVVGSFTPTTPSASYDVTITSAITGDNTYAFCLKLSDETSGDGVKFHSRETASGTGPQLIVTYTEGGVEPQTQVAKPGADMIPIPEWATGGKVLQWTPVYYAAVQGAAGGVDLAPGTSIWVYGLDQSGKFYMGMLAGEKFWLPVAVVGPNYESPWFGRPLPTQVVDGEGNAL